MFNLTRQERIAVLFISGLLILGAAINYVLKINPKLINFELIETPLLKPAKININNATREKLKIIPGIGEVIAQRIIAQRESQGLFKRIEDLEKVKGISKKKLDIIKEYIVLH